MIAAKPSSTVNFQLVTAPSGVAVSFDNGGYGFGNAQSIPVPADYFGDGRSAYALWTPNAQGGMTFTAILIIFGHWIDFYQMVMPGTVKGNPKMSWYEFGIPIGFVGLILWGVGRYISKVPLLAKHHPFLKESMIHHT